MCGRVYRPSSREIFKEINGLKEAHIRISEDFLEERNLKITGSMPIITQSEPDLVKLAYWGLVPFYAKEFKMQYSTFNATSEKLFTANTWKPLIEKKHCVVIAKSFYEWNYDDPIKKTGKHIYRITSAGSSLTYMAGLYESWTDKSTGEIKDSCTIITNPANELMARIHNTKARMPAFLSGDNFTDWINPEIDIQERIKLISPVKNEFLDAVEIQEI